MAGLKRQAFAGGTYLLARQVIAMVVGLVGVLLLTRFIGPYAYGRYTGSLVFVILLATVGRAGVDVYLVRRPVVPDPHTYAQALTVLLAFGIIVGGAAAFLVPLVLSHVGDKGFATPFRVLLISLPLTLLQTPPMAKLERDLNYRAIAMIEMTFQILFYAFAVPLAYVGLGVWAPVTAWLTGTLAIVPSTYIVARARPRLTRSLSGVGEMLTYSASFAASNWMWEARPLVNPLVVGHFFGPVGVGYVSVAIRIVETLGVAKMVAYRLSIALFAKVSDDLVRLRRGVEESMPLQVLATAPPLIAFGLAAHHLIPVLFGSRWLPAIQVFPFVALALIVNAVFNIESSALYVVGKNNRVARFNAVNILLLATAAVLLLPHFGLKGYGFAELIALPSYILLDRSMRSLFTVSYRETIPWFVALTPPLFAVLTPVIWRPLLFIPLVVVLLSRKNRGRLAGYVRTFMPRANQPAPIGSSTQPRLR